MKKIICVILCVVFMIIPISNTVFAGTYTDVSDGKWYTEAVNFCLANRLIEPENESFFGRTTNITRGELAQVLWNIAGKPTVEPDDPELDDVEMPFPDVVRFDKYTDAIRWCDQYHVLFGYETGIFGVNDTLTRQQFAVALKAVAKYKGYDISATTSLAKFSDSNTVSSWAKDAVTYCVASGLISGKTDGAKLLLSPKSSITRAEVAEIVKSFFTKVASAEMKKQTAGNYVLDGGSGSGSGDGDIFWDEMISLTTKPVPNLLYIGFALEDASGDYSYVKNLVEGEEYHCKADMLTEQDIKDISVAKAKIDAADIIFVCGGSSIRLLNMLKEYNILALIRSAQERGAVMCGSSAGAICFSAFGESQTELGYWRIDGTAGVNVLYCPHALTDSRRYDKLESELRETPYIKAVALDGACLVVKGDQYKVDIYKTGYMANLCQIIDGKYVVTPLSTEWAPLSDIAG